MADKTGPRPKGICPDCGRIIPGRPLGAGAGRTWVALSPHATRPRRGAVCLPRGSRRVVPLLDVPP